MAISDGLYIETCTSPGCRVKAAWEWRYARDRYVSYLCNGHHKLVSHSGLLNPSLWTFAPHKGRDLATELNADDACDCPMDLLMRSGCKCGGL